jgi:hypothetical protein
VAVHVAILKRPYVEDVLAGTKTVESRMMKVRCPPFGQVRVGERLYLKVSAGPFRAIARAAAVHDFSDLTPEDMRELEARFRPRVGGDDAYWQSKRSSRCATFIELDGVEPIDVGPAYTKSMQAWHVLDGAADPIREVTLTAGAIRNRYVSLRGRSESLRRSGAVLCLPDGREIETGFYRGGSRLNWRGWQTYFERHAMRPGDAVRFLALGDRRYRVTFRRRTDPVG